MVDVIYRPNPLPIEQIKKLPELECLFPIPENYEEILEDVQQRGIQEPLVVNPENVLVCGFTRLQIAADLGLTEVPVRVIPHTDILDLKEYAIRDNFHRRQLTKLQLVELCGIPLEQIEAERARLRMQSGRTVDPVENVATGSPGKTRDKVGDFLGMSGRSYSSYRKIALKGSSKTKALFNSGELTQRNAAQLASLPVDEQEKLLTRLEGAEIFSSVKLADRINSYHQRLAKRAHQKAQAEAAQAMEMSWYKDAIAAGVVVYEEGSWVVKARINKPLPGIDAPYPRYSGQEIFPIDYCPGPCVEEET